jgi:alpha-mannosidase
LLWNSHSEATLWVDGRSVQGLNMHAGDRPDAILTGKASAGQAFDLVVEMACNGKFGARSAAQATHISPFFLDQCEIAAFDPEAWELYYDFMVLQELEADLAKEKGSMELAWAGELLAELNRFANVVDLDDRATWKEGHAILKALYQRKNASHVHELSAIGHAHIDTAWLWPLAETWRKCVRTFSTATAYMESYPDYRFSCSQAAQYEEIKRRNPDLYERIKRRVKAGQFVPVGGTWIEPDCNIPSGEALCRQFLFGQRFFEREFGIRCKEFWNPDVFGYNGQLPQIMRLAGIERFLTQKLSWNAFNKPQHHTFTWEGIDGSRVLAHFPPADTYNAVATIAQLRENARNFKDNDRSHHSLMLFGFGDGGGGPTKRMLETLRRAKDLQGLPRTNLRTSDAFFELLERDITDRPRLVGELYFELHRGTYTSQAAVKRGNRKSEFLLHDIEFLATMATAPAATRGRSSAGGAYQYPAGELEALWKLVLLNQFHDILPGSSITLVYDDAAKHYAEIEQRGSTLREAAAKALLGAGAGPAVVNTIGFARGEVVTLPGDELALAEAPSYGVGRVVETPPDVVSVTEVGKHVVLENAHLRAELAPEGTVVSLVEKHTGRESLAGPANLLKLYEDRPGNWDAWDVDPFHLETERDCPPAESMRVTLRSPLRAEVAFERKVGAKSRMTQVVRLDAAARRLEFHADVDWHEDHKFLKAVFPLNVRAMHATYEMQFGNVERPTHFNTSFDLARYEVPGHKWADLSEHGFGVALLSESKYGFSAYDNALRISLLRAPKSPDPQADMGRHRFAYALYPHAGGWREGGVVAEGFRFNVPLLVVPGAPAPAEPRSFASVDDPNLVLDTIKRAEDGDGIVLRLYECHGARGAATVRLDVPVKSAALVNVLEEDLKDAGAATVSGNTIEVPYAPYKVITLRVR